MNGSVIYSPGWGCLFYQTHYLLSSSMCSFDNSDILGPFKVERRESQIAIWFSDMMPAQVEFSTSNKHLTTPFLFVLFHEPC